MAVGRKKVIITVLTLVILGVAILIIMLLCFSPVEYYEVSKAGYICKKRFAIFLGRKKVIITVLTLVILGVAILIIMLLCFSPVEYYEYGFRRLRSGGTVNTDTVYTGGKYFLGPDSDFITYRADAHFVTLNNIDVFTRDKLEVKITVHFQYFLRKDELANLHREFNDDYSGVMTASAQDAIKGAIPVYTTRELISNRTDVESELYQAVRQRLGGICCLNDCSLYENACPESCKARDECDVEDQGLHVDVIYFQLAKVTIPSSVGTLFLKVLIQQEDALRAKLVQEANLIKKDTNVQVKGIKNEAFEITQNASALAQTILKSAYADSDRIKEKARIVGMQRFYGYLNITGEEHMLSVDYLRTMKASNKVKMTINFDQKIAGNF